MGFVVIMAFKDAQYKVDAKT